MHSRLSWAQSACARVLRPLVRLALAMGLKYPHLDELLRNLMVEDARRIWQARGVKRPNVSQISISTGINRKDVAARIQQVDQALPHTEASSASRAFTLWLQMAARDPALRRLSLRPDSGSTSFEAVARQSTRGDVHHRALLDELIRLGLAIETDEHVELAAEAFVPSQDLQSLLAFLGDNARDHLQAAVSNTLGERAPMLERAIFVDGLSAEDCVRLDRLARERWDTLHRELFDEMTASLERAPQPGTHRMRVGIYTYYEDEALPPKGSQETPE